MKLKFIQRTKLIALITVMPSFLLSCAKGEVETKEAKCNRLLEFIVDNSKKEIPKMLPGRRNRATIMVTMLERNRDKFVQTCLQKSDKEIDAVFKNSQSK